MKNITAQDHIEQQFKKDLRELLRKYNAHLYADEGTGITVAIDGTYNPHGETLSLPAAFDIGDHFF
jgi:hypothetical protein